MIMSTITTTPTHLLLQTTNPLPLLVVAYLAIRFQEERPAIAAASTSATATVRALVGKTATALGALVPAATSDVNI